MKACDNKPVRTSASVPFAFCLAIGLTSWIGAAPTDNSMHSAPIDPAVVAPAQQLGRAFAMVAAHVRPAVVSVYSEKVLKFTQPDLGFLFNDEFLRQFLGGHLPQQQPGLREYRVPQRGMGSGMILDKEGHILTNFHVVKDVDEIKVQLADKSQFEAEIVGTDRQTDVAIIKLKGRVPDDLPTITLGDSDTLQAGEIVLAIGVPFGLAQSVTEGIISATGRSDMGIEDFEDFLQTDAPINPGNSGGPLVSMRGEVIGMNTAIASTMGQSDGVSFAIPSGMIKAMLPKLLKGEKIVRGQLGVVIQNLTRELAAQFGLPTARGALVAQVNKDSSADKAGMEVGDVITRYDGHDVRDSGHVRKLVAETIPGTEVKIEVFRRGKAKALLATIGKWEPASDTAAVAAEEPAVLEKIGLTVQTLTSDMAKQLGLGADKGVVISDVEDGSLAAFAGLQKGDLIAEADHKPVADMAELNQALAKAGDRVLLLIKRQKGSLFIVLQMK